MTARIDKKILFLAQKLFKLIEIFKINVLNPSQRCVKISSLIRPIFKMLTFWILNYSLKNNQNF